MVNEKLSYTRKDDMMPDTYHEWASDTDAFLGTWHNANVNTRHISKLIVSQKEDQFFLQCFGQLEEGLMDWGESKCETFSVNVGSPLIEGFMCSYDFDFMKTEIVGNLKYGTMVIQTYNAFSDSSGRNNYFSREFFCKK